MTRKTLLLFVVVAAALFVSPDAARAAPPSGHARGYSGAFHPSPLHGGAHYVAPHYVAPRYSYPHNGFHPSATFHPRTFFWYGGYPYYGTYGYPYSGYNYPSSGYSYGYPNSGATTYYGTGYYPYLSGALAPSSDSTDSATAGVTSSGQAASSSLSSPASADSPAKIAVRLPESAELWIDGVKRGESGSAREFTTPMLSAGTKYTYEIHARWVEGDTTIDQTRKVVFAAGDKLDVTFPVPSGGAEKAKEVTP